MIYIRQVYRHRQTEDRAHFPTAAFGRKRIHRTAMFAAQLDNIVCKEDTALVQAIDFIVCGRRHRYDNAVLHRFFQNQLADSTEIELVKN